MQIQVNSGIEYMLENPKLADKFIEVISMQNLPTTEDFKNAFLDDLNYYSNDKVGYYIPKFFKKYKLKRSIVNTLKDDLDCIYKIYEEYKQSLPLSLKNNIVLVVEDIALRLQYCIISEFSYQEIYKFLQKDFEALFLQLHLLNSKIKSDIDKINDIHI